MNELQATEALKPFTADDLSMLWDDDVRYPFVENEECNITGYGHQDKAEFATAINRYDEMCNGEGWTEADEPTWSASDVSHKYAVRVSEERCQAIIDGIPVGPDTPGAFPITTLWGQR